MPIHALAIALLLLGLGALLNTAVLAYFLWHTLRAFTAGRYRPAAASPRALASAHR